MVDNTFFYLGLCAIIIHEMDAIRCKEWRIFPGLSLLNDTWGFNVFMLAHVPLFYFLFSALVEPNERTGLMHGLDIFFIVHMGLHLLFLHHPKNEFNDWLSWTVIVSAGLFGGIDLII